MESIIGNLDVSHVPISKDFLSPSTTIISRDPLNYSEQYAEVDTMIFAFEPLLRRYSGGLIVSSTPKEWISLGHNGQSTSV